VIQKEKQTITLKKFYRKRLFFWSGSGWVQFSFKLNLLSSGNLPNKLPKSNLSNQ